MPSFAIKQATFIKSAPTVGHLPPDERRHVAFVGRSNVGKSSLINAVCAKNGLAKVSRTPGRTQSLNVFLITLLRRDDDGSHQERQAYLIDLPGYGFAEIPADERERLTELVTSYMLEEARVRLVLQLLDIRREVRPDDLRVSHTMRRSAAAYKAVITKADQLPVSKRKPRVAELAKQIELPPEHVLLTSVNDNIGLESVVVALWDALA